MPTVDWAWRMWNENFWPWFGFAILFLGVHAVFWRECRKNLVLLREATIVEAEILEIGDHRYTGNDVAFKQPLKLKTTLRLKYNHRGITHECLYVAPYRYLSKYHQTRQLKIVIPKNDPDKVRTMFEFEEWFSVEPTSQS